MKHLLLLASFILLGLGKANCQAQAPDWVWAKSAPSDTLGYGEGWSIATDKSNNVYIAGYYRDTITIGSFILTAIGISATFLAKYDSQGNAKWAKSSINNVGGYSLGDNVCADPFGNLYITGYFLNAVSFGPYSLASNGNIDIFLVKYDSSGNVLWAKNNGGTSSDNGYGVSTDRFGNVYITGYFRSATVTFGSYTLVNAGIWNMFLAKYDSSGNVIWAKSAGGTSSDEGFSVATDALANVYVTGYFNSSTITFGSYTLNNAGTKDIFLTKYDSSGNVLWAKSAGGAGDDNGTYVVADSSGNAYLTGSYASPLIYFDSDTLSNAGNQDAFLTKYDSSGNVGWAKTIGGTGHEHGYCVATDNSNRIYISGEFNSPTVTFDTIAIHPMIFSNDLMFVAGYDSSGHALFAKALASGGDDQNAVASSPSGCIYIGGDFYNVSPFIVGNDSLYLSGGEDVFVAKLCYPDIIETAPEITTNKQFHFYPNPFDDKLNISAVCNDPCAGKDEERRLLLYDVTGRLLLRCSFTNSATINTAHLARGIYFYEVSDKDGVGARGKVIKE